MKRIILILIAMFTLTINSIGFADSENGIPLEKGEKLLDYRELQDGKIEAFVDIDGEYYKKIFARVDIENETLENENLSLLSSEKIQKRNTGLNLDKSPKDKNITDRLSGYLKSKKMGSGLIPSRVDYSNSPYLPQVGDQGMTNSCVGWAAGYYLRTYQQAKDLGWSIKDTYGKNRKDRIFSPSFIYNQINDGYDDGAYIADAAILLQNVGSATIEDFPYSVEEYFVWPDTKTISKAYAHRIEDFLGIDLMYLQAIGYPSKEIIQSVKEYISMDEELVVAGLPIGFSWYEPYEYNGQKFIVTDSYFIGGHAVAIVGYDDNIKTPEGRGAFKIINSWGKDWGDRGYAYITYEAFERLCNEIWLFLDLENNEKPVEEIKELKGEMISPKQVKYTWMESQNATSYTIYDENKNIISDNIYKGEYIEILDNPQQVTRYVQAFNDIYKSDMAKITVSMTTEVPSKKITYDRQSSRILESKYNQLKDKEWKVRFNKKINYGEYLKDNVFVVDKDNNAQSINIQLGDDLKTIKVIPPAEGYKSGETYTLVLKGIRDESGKDMKQVTIMDFTIK